MKLLNARAVVAIFGLFLHLHPCLTPFQFFRFVVSSHANIIVNNIIVNSRIKM